MVVEIVAVEEEKHLLQVDGGRGSSSRGGEALATGRKW
jgi:hypothetical protein